MQAARQGEFQFVYVTPEFVAGQLDMIHALHSVRNFGLIGIDEAHCITDWGKDYRKDFATLHKLRHSGGPLVEVPIIAVTATASLDVQVCRRASSYDLLHHFIRHDDQGVAVNVLSIS